MSRWPLDKTVLHIGKCKNYNVITHQSSEDKYILFTLICSLYVYFIISRHKFKRLFISYFFAVQLKLQ